MDFKGFRENHVFEEDRAWKGILDGTWVDFDAKKGPKRLPNRTQNGAKMGSKNVQKIISVLERILDPVHWGSAPTTERAGAVEGVGGGINPSL